MTGTASRTLVPAEVVAWVAAGRAALAVGGQAGDWTAGTRIAVLAELCHVERLAAALRAAVVNAERAAGTWSLAGDRDLAGFVGRESHQGRGAGLAVVAQAATLEAMPVLAGALVDGPVTLTHVAQVTRASASSPVLAAELATPEGQARVVELARRLDGSEFGRQLTAWGASSDPASRQRSHDEQRADRFLAVSHTSGGTLIRGLLDRVAGYRFATMLDAFNPRPAVGDERSREQRQADALLVAVDRMLAEKDATGATLAPVQALITMSEETWTALRGDLGPDGGSGPERDAVISAGRGSAGDLIGRLAGRGPVVDETGQPWPASEIGRALCDCALTRAVIGATGQPLDLGRDSRLFKRAHWLALHASGVRACAVAGCGMPLAFTELHHLQWWDRDGGRTDLANCIAYCAFHHHEIHRWDIAVTRLPDGSYEHRHPDGRRYGGAPPEVLTLGPPGDLLTLLPA